MANDYRNGATVYQLAQEFGISRHTVSARLKKAGVTMRGEPLKLKDVDSMVRLYASGLSLLEVGKKVGYNANTVRNCLLERQIQTRDSHGRDR